MLADVRVPFRQLRKNESEQNTAFWGDQNRNNDCVTAPAPPPSFKACNAQGSTSLRKLDHFFRCGVGRSCLCARLASYTTGDGRQDTADRRVGAQDTNKIQ